MQRFLTIVLAFLLAAPVFAPTPRYVGPSGVNSTCSLVAPCSPKTALAAMIAGDVTFMTDGFYKGSDFMLVPYPCKAGTASSMLQVFALHDGKVDIDGQDARRTVYLGAGCNYWDIEGINAHNVAGGDVWDIHGSHNILRRDIGWDAPTDMNLHIFGVHGSKTDDSTDGYGNLLEDIGCLGRYRKCIDPFYSHGNTFRRVAGRIEGSIQTGPKRFIQTNYHSYNNVFDDVIGFFDLTQLPVPTYRMMNNGVIDYGQPGWPGVKQPDGSVIVTSPKMEGAQGMIGEIENADSSDPVNGNSIVSGALVMLMPWDKVAFQGSASSNYAPFTFRTYGNTTGNDWFVYAPGMTEVNAGASVRGVSLTAVSTAALSHVNGLTTVIPGSNVIDANKYIVSNFINSTTLTGALGTGSLYTGSSLTSGGGAKLDYQHFNGVKDPTKPFWPWAMSDRILAASIQMSTDGHGHKTLDINSLVQATFGPFPGGPPPTKTATVSPSPTLTPTPTFTLTPTWTPTLTLTPTYTLTPTLTLTFTPTVTPTMTDLNQQDRIRALERVVYTPVP